MAIKDVVKVSRKTFFNPRAWLGYETLKESTQGFMGIMRSVFGQRVFEPAAKETFADAVARFNLTEKDLNEIKLTYFSYALLFVLIAVGVLVYGIWLLTHGHFHATVLSLAIVVLLLGQAFRFHFLYFQIKHRKLGCTFEEWRSGKVQSGGDNA
jgi:intracellular multiplication protein IcmV